jgi:serine/threonine protein kinase
MTFLLLTGEILFEDQRRLGQYVADRFEFSSNSLFANNISEKEHDFIKNSMKPKPENRLNVAECLQHPWLKSQRYSFL